MEPPNGSGGGTDDVNHSHTTEISRDSMKTGTLKARGRGGGWRGAIATSVGGIRETDEFATNITNNDGGGQRDGEAMGPNDSKEETDEEMEEKNDEEARVKEGSLLGNEGSRRLAEEYKQLVKDILTWEIVVEKKQESLTLETNEEEKERIRGTIESSKALLERFREEERNHFFSGAYRDNMDMIWDDSDEEEDDKDENIEIIEVIQGKQSKNNRDIIHTSETDRRLNEEEIAVEDFIESDDEDMGEDVPVTLQVGKRKTRDEFPVLNCGQQEEDKGDWKLVVNKKIYTKETKETKNLTKNDSKNRNSNNTTNAETKGNSNTQTIISDSTGQMGRINRAEQQRVATTYSKRENAKTRSDITGVYSSNNDTVEKNVKINEQSRIFGESGKGQKEGMTTGKEKQHKVGEARSSLQRTITSYASATKMKQNQNQIRFNFSFNVRVNSPSEWRRVAKILLEQSQEIDRKSYILPWDDSKVENYQGITLDMVTNKLTMRDSMIAKYFNARGNMIPGKVYYQAGVRFSTETDINQFIDQWNRNKRDRKERGLEVINIGHANMQNSADSFLIGIAVGSSEDQDTTILNKELETATGISGIEVSYQNFYQAGITNEFWDIANKKAKATGAHEMSRDYLRCKYSWAPSALAVFVPKIHMVAQARKIMIQKYGKLVDGSNPQWPDGTRMRFLPIKGGNLRSEKTKAIIKKRIAYHIWIKAHERIITTNLINIHEGQELFEGQSLSQVILQKESTLKDNMGLFRHFKRMWSTGQDNAVRWAISVHKGLYDEAVLAMRGLQQELVNEYGDKVNYFFLAQTFRATQKDQRGPIGDDDEDNWFDDDDSIPEKDVIEQGFEKFMEDDQSEVSWGTNMTKYTELVQPSTQSTTTSSLTQEVLQVDAEELDRRHSAVEHYLVTQYQMDRETIQRVKNHEAPYRIVTRTMKDKVWEIDEVLDGIVAIFQAQKVQKAPDPMKNNHDDDEQL
jgi:hypothetical protein